MAFFFFPRTWDTSHWKENVLAWVFLNVFLFQLAALRDERVGSYTFFLFTYRVSFVTGFASCLFVTFCICLNIDIPHQCKREKKKPFSWYNNDIPLMGKESKAYIQTVAIHITVVIEKIVVDVLDLKKNWKVCNSTGLVRLFWRNQAWICLVFVFSFPFPFCFRTFILPKMMLRTIGWNLLSILDLSYLDN